MRDPVKLESMTAVFQNKVRGTARIDESDTAVGTPQPRDGSGPVWPANKSSFMFYGKGPR